METKQMNSRRKTKTERELIADIHKTFNIFCKSKYKSSSDCRLDWIIELLEKDNKEV